MKKYIFCTVGIVSFLAAGSISAVSLGWEKRGQVVSDSDNHGALWYVHPEHSTRWYIPDGRELFTIIASQSIGVKHEDLVKIPEAGGRGGDAALIQRLKGRFLIDVTRHGEAWYVNPRDGVRYYLSDGLAGYAVLQGLASELSVKELKKIPMDPDQLVYDYTFQAVAHVKYSHGVFSGGYYSGQVLPIASLTKLMTALVVLDTVPNWDKKIMVTLDDLRYPKQFVGDDATSEIDLQAGDTLSLRDLWGAMLLASSNQAAGILSKNVGLTPEQFVKKMNEKARALGLKKTRFTDPSGLDLGNVSTAKEMAKLAQAAFQQALISQATLKPFTITVREFSGTTRDLPVVNRNYSLTKFGADAAKTGFLIEAQRTVVLKKGRDIVVVLHARSMKERNGIIQRLLAE